MKPINKFRGHYYSTEFVNLLDTDLEKIFYRESYPIPEILIQSITGFTWTSINDLKTRDSVEVILTEVALDLLRPKNDIHIINEQFLGLLRNHKHDFWNPHFNWSPRTFTEKLSAIKFFEILSQYSGLTANAPQYRQIMHGPIVGAAYIYRMGLVGLMMTNERDVINYYRLGSTDEWSKLNSEQTAMFAGDNS